MMGSFPCTSSCVLASGLTGLHDGLHPEDIDCPAYLKAYQVLRTYLKYPDFKPGQLEALLPCLHGKDVFVRMGTGAGKSLCMYLGPLAISPHATCVIISPLVGLMEQQVN